MIKTILTAAAAGAALAGASFAATGSAQAHSYGYNSGYGYASSYGYSSYAPSYTYRTVTYYQPTCGYVTKRIIDSYGCEQFIQVRVCN